MWDHIVSALAMPRGVGQRPLVCDAAPATLHPCSQCWTARVKCYLIPEVHAADALGVASSATGRACPCGVCVVVIVLAMPVSKTVAPTR